MLSGWLSQPASCYNRPLIVIGLPIRWRGRAADTKRREGDSIPVFCQHTVCFHPDERKKVLFDCETLIDIYLARPIRLLPAYRRLACSGKM